MGKGRNSMTRLTSAMMANEGTQAFHQQQLQKLYDGDYPMNETFEINTLEVLHYNDGYQVSFYNIGDNYTTEEYRDLVNEFLAASSDHIASAGKFEGTPEISFHIADRGLAMALGKRYNQKSIWDWENMDEIEIEGGTGVRNQ